MVCIVAGVGGKMLEGGTNTTGGLKNFGVFRCIISGFAKEQKDVVVQGGGGGGLNGEGGGGGGGGGGGCQPCFMPLDSVCAIVKFSQGSFRMTKVLSNKTKKVQYVLVYIYSQIVTCSAQKYSGTVTTVFRADFMGPFIQEIGIFSTVFH